MSQEATSSKSSSSNPKCRFLAYELAICQRNLSGAINWKENLLESKLRAEFETQKVIFTLQPLASKHYHNKHVCHSEVFSTLADFSQIMDIPPNLPLSTYSFLFQPD